METAPPRSPYHFHVFFIIFMYFELCLGAKSTGTTESFLQIDQNSFKIGAGAPIRPRRGELTEAEAATGVRNRSETSHGLCMSTVLKKPTTFFFGTPPRFVPHETRRQRGVAKFFHHWVPEEL